MPDVIPRFSGEHAFLSNFYAAPVVINTVTFPTNEHAFQAAKADCITVSRGKSYFLHGILACKTPGEAKGIGRTVSIDVDKWNAVRVRNMRNIVRAKFDQNPDLREKLIRTGHAMLVEGNTWGDTFWGRCDGKGANILGVILMELRGFYLWGNQPTMFGEIAPLSEDDIHTVN